MESEMVACRFFLSSPRPDLLSSPFFIAFFLSFLILSLSPYLFLFLVEGTWKILTYPNEIRKSGGVDGEECQQKPPRGHFRFRSVVATPPPPPLSLNSLLNTATVSHFVKRSTRPDSHSCKNTPQLPLRPPTSVLAVSSSPLARVSCKPANKQRPGWFIKIHVENYSFVFYYVQSRFFLHFIFFPFPLLILQLSRFSVVDNKKYHLKLCFFLFSSGKLHKYNGGHDFHRPS